MNDQPPIVFISATQHIHDTVCPLSRSLELFGRLDAVSRDLAIIAETDVERAGAFRRHLGRIPDR